jgi:beta-mannanase
MNDPYRYPWGPQNNKPVDFINAWRHVVKLFKDAGATNVIWIWSPHPAYANYDAYYPGDAFVDWVGVGTLNYGTVATWSKWWSFDEIFGNYYPQLSKYKKPIMITEFGSLGVGGNRAKWYKDALTDMPIKYPEIKSVIFFHCKNDNTTTYKALDWYIKDDTLTLSAIRNATHNFSPLVLSKQ